ncbi:MAG: rhodanese-like domain-containing protein [Bacteroidetes bacterium]|nr:rhodanese-like domain-containing protein [Bacteroidota bacterium]MBS1932232.1 rhodanese-like domain-containing protein [Bacteroidota bacterium]
MIQLLKRIFGTGSKTDFKALVQHGAQIVDVRTKEEYQSGHIQGSVNLPLNNIGNQLNKLKKEKAVITCCASGMRSAAARNILKSRGFTEVYNGGGWRNLQNKLN